MQKEMEKSYRNGDTGKAEQRKKQINQGGKSEEPPRSMTNEGSGHGTSNERIVSMITVQSCYELLDVD